MIYIIVEWQFLYWIVQDFMVYRAWNCLKWGPVLHAFPTHCFGFNCTGNLLFCENPVYNGTGTATLRWALHICSYNGTGIFNILRDKLGVTMSPSVWKGELEKVIILMITHWLQYHWYYVNPLNPVSWPWLLYDLVSACVAIRTNSFHISSFL